MEVLVFANPKDSAIDRFFQEISKVPRLSPKFVLQDKLFISLLMRNAIDWRVIVFFAYDRRDLALAISLRDCLMDTRLILVLSDWNEEAVKMGLTLSPCLIANANGEFSDVVAVLEKISSIAP